MASRRRARRRGLVVALVATVAVLAADLTVRSFADGPDEQLAYLDRTRPLIEASTLQGLDLAELRRDAPSLQRAAFDRRLDRLVDQTAATLAEATSLTAPEPLREAGALLVGTLSVRAGAATRFRAALHQLLGSGTVDEAATHLAGVGSDLLVADRTFQLFAEAAASTDSEASVPPSAWVADPAAWTPEAVTAFTVALRAAGNLATVTDAGIITVQLSPSPVSAEGDVQVLATDEPLEVTVVVANRGSTRLSDVPLVAELAVDGEAEPRTVVADVDLDPGAEQTVVLDPLEPVEGRAALLTVRIGPVPGESTATDNTTTVRLRVRDPGEATTTTAPTIVDPAAAG